MVATSLAVLLVVGQLGAALAGPASQFTVGLGLDAYTIEMTVSTESDTTARVHGWVDVNDMRPSETVSVQLDVTGFQDLYATPNPGGFFFERNGRQHFNLSLVMKEDAPLHEDYYEIIISATAKTYLDQEIVDEILKVVPTFQISASANFVRQPNEVGPGGMAFGVVSVHNTGSIYSEYQLGVRYDPDDVVEELRFEKEAELTPGFWEEFDVVVVVAEDAPPGRHQVEVVVTANTQYDIWQEVATVRMEVDVADAGPVLSPTSLVALIIVIVLAVAVTAFLLRRKV